MESCFVFLSSFSGQKNNQIIPLVKVGARVSERLGWFRRLPTVRSFFSFTLFYLTHSTRCIDCFANENQLPVRRAGHSELLELEQISSNKFPLFYAFTLNGKDVFDKWASFLKAFSPRSIWVRLLWVPRNDAKWVKLLRKKESCHHHEAVNHFEREKVSAAGQFAHLFWKRGSVSTGSSSKFLRSCIQIM